MAADFPTSLADFLSYAPASEKGVPFDVMQNIMDEILAVQTLLGAGSAPGTAFTPTIVSSGGGTPTYTVQVARYRRFMGLVQFTGYVKLASFGTLAAGTITIAGLPVASVNTASLFSSVTIPWWGGLTTPATHLTGTIAANASSIVLYLVTGTAVVTPAQLTKADLTATSELIFSGIYPAT
jgi:hypothetical protein